MISSSLRADTATWKGGSGNYGSTGSWSGGVVPNGGTFDVIIDGKTSSASTVSITSFATPTVAIRSLTVSAGDQLSLGNNTQLTTTQFSNAGTVILQQNAGTLGSLNGGTLSVRNFGTFTIGQMNVDFFSNNGTVNLAAGSTAAAKTKGFSMTELNLNDRAFLVDYDGASPLASLTAKLKKGYDASAGRWKGAVSAIFSDSAAADPSHRSIGIAEVSTLFSASLPATFLGQIVDATTVAIRYTYAGDANLDGVVNVVDLGLLASHWQQSGAWSGGDFNYDGKVDVIDLGILASDWQLGAAGPGVGFADALASAGLGGASVPEPAIALVIPLLLLRRRQRVAYCCS